MLSFQPQSFLSFFTVFCLLLDISEGYAAHYFRRPRLPHHYPRRSLNDSAPFPVIGIPPVEPGSIPKRLEIRQLQKNTCQWNLYLLAMAQYQSMNQSTMTSYYQIAGIHGRPYVPWNNVLFAPGRTGGYCTHSSTLFPTWHRPYVALFEQVLYNIVQDIAMSFGNQSDCVNAAVAFRAPYWDWLSRPPAGQDTMPACITSPAPVQVITPNGTQMIPNPLYRYHFSPLSSAQFPDYPFSVWPDTLRSPTSNALNATSQDALISSQFNKNQASYIKRYLNLLQAYPTYAKFSNKFWLNGIKNPGGSYDSLESLHDAVHGLIGKGGHFTYNEYSAFDPIFMLHHVNVDRLFAIWQVINPSTYVSNTLAAFGTATITPGDIITPETPLTPFHSSTNGTFWTSATVRSTHTFGYTYPEIADNNASCTIQAVNYLYGPSAGEPANKTLSSLAKRGSVERDGLQRPGSYYEWITNIRVAQNALDSTFTIFVFLGDFNPDLKYWLTDPHLVGSHTVFTPFSSDTQQKAGTLVAGTVPLTKDLNENAVANGYDTANITSVEAYLKTNLHWRVAKLMDDTEVSRDSLPNLRVSVVSCPVTEAESDHNFPDWGDCTPHTNITDSKSAGLSAGEPT